MAAKGSVSGAKRLEKKLARLRDKESFKLAKKAVRKGVAAQASGIRKEAPVGKTGQLKAAIGSRLNKDKKKRLTTFGKAGANVGKRKERLAKRSKKTGKKVNVQAPHAHLVALGTKQRKRKKIGGKFSYLNPPTSRQLRTGKMTPDAFVLRGAKRAEKKAFNRMLRELKKIPKVSKIGLKRLSKATGG